MKIICQRDRLLTAFQLAATVVPARTPKSILRNVKLEVHEGVLTLSATDMEIGIRIELGEIEVQQPGRIVVPVAQFGSMLRESADTQLEIESGGQHTIVRGERSEVRLATENPDEYPAVQLFEETAFHVVPARLLRELIRRTSFATETESGRYALGGILLEWHDDRVIAVATDGRRLAKMEGPAQANEGHGAGDTNTIVPTRAMQLIERTLTDSDAEIHLTVRANDLLVRSPRVTISTRLVEGRFPRWRDVFPQRGQAVQIQLTAGPLHAALRQAAIVASEESRGIDFTFGEGSLVLAGSTADVGQSRVELPIAYDGQPITVRLDHRFVGDFLKVLDPEKAVTVDIEHAEAAALFTTDDGYGYVVMPLARDG